MPTAVRIDQFDRHAEDIAATSGVVSVGIGPTALAVIGLPGETLGRLILESFDQLIDGGANLLIAPDPQGRKHRLYACRRGRCVDAGTRKDFAQLGWEKICDVLDAQHDQNEVN
jgi:hypothetical protein